MAQQPLIEARESPGPGRDNHKPFFNAKKTDRKLLYQE